MMCQAGTNAVEHPLFRLTVAVIVIVPLLLCVTCADRQTAGSASGRPSPAPTTEAVTPGTTPEPRAPNLNRYGDPLARLAYKEGFSACASGRQAVSRTYDVGSDDATEVAATYAANTYPETDSLRLAALQGCLDRLRARP